MNDNVSTAAPTPLPPLTLDGAMMQMLTSAKAHHMKLLAVPLEGYPNAVAQRALTQLVGDECLRLLDVCMMPSGEAGRQGRVAVSPHRVFRLTDEGTRKLALLMVSAK